MKHYLWHGNVAQAVQGLDCLEEDLDCWGCDEQGRKHRQSNSAKALQMLKYVRQFATFITNNSGSIVNYGEHYRCGERISTGFVEPTDQPGREQAHGKEAADAVDARWRSPTAPGAYAGAQWRLGRDVSDVVFRLPTANCLCCDH